MRSEKSREEKNILSDLREDFFCKIYSNIHDLGISPNAMTVYVLFCCMAGPEDREIYPPYAHITEKCGIKDSKTIKKALDELEELQLIKLERRKARGQNTYKISLLDHRNFKKPKKHTAKKSKKEESIPSYDLDAFDKQIMEEYKKGGEE